MDKWTGLRRQQTNYTTNDPLFSLLMSLCHIPEGCSSIRRHTTMARSSLLCFTICSRLVLLALPSSAAPHLVLFTKILGHPMHTHVAPSPLPLPLPLPVAFIVVIAHKRSLRLRPSSSLESYQILDAVVAATIVVTSVSD